MADTTVLPSLDALIQQSALNLRLLMMFGVSKAEASAQQSKAFIDAGFSEAEARIATEKIMTLATVKLEITPEMSEQFREFFFRQTEKHLEKGQTNG